MRACSATMRCCASSCRPTSSSSPTGVALEEPYSSPVGVFRSCADSRPESELFARCFPNLGAGVTAVLATTPTDLNYILDLIKITPTRLT